MDFDFCSFFHKTSLTPNYLGVGGGFCFFLPSLFLLSSLFTSVLYLSSRDLKKKGGGWREEGKEGGKKREKAC